MNVLQLISSGLGYYGAERVVVTLSAALEAMGANTIVGAFLNSAKDRHLEVLDHAKISGLRTEQIRCHGRLDRQAIIAIRQLVERYKIDVVHCHGIKPDLYAWLATRGTAVALVSTCHLWTFDNSKEWLVSATERCLLHGVDRVVVVSDHIAPQVQRFGLKATVIYNGIDLEPFRSPNANLRKRMNWGDRPVIGAIGRLAAQKGLHNLLVAAPQVLKKHPNALFVLAGDGPERSALEAQARNLGIGDAVCFLGFQQDIPEVLASIDILAMPSLSEGMPMSLLEAMACGRAVVASSVGAIPRVIQDRLNGIFVPSQDPDALAGVLKELVGDQNLRTKLGLNAQSTIKSRFSAAGMAEQYLEVYRSASARRIYGRSSTKVAVSSVPRY